MANTGRPVSRSNFDAITDIAQSGLDAVGLLPQLVHATASDELTLFQQPHDRRHP
ncbi:hypothetical protein [Streptomyces sp. NPDC096311]|uniref:hypothetical protein n=1 Tax=Streptomyces sp. NPDC096311 TaxID=3366083 RepID=UPI0038256581